MGKTINTILNLTDKFTPKLSAAGKQSLIFKQQLKNCNTAADKIDSGLNKLAKTAAVAGAAGAAAMGAFAASSLNTYKDFQQSMSNVAGIMSIDAGSDTYMKLEAAAREAGRTTTKTAQESADALSYMALAGWSVEDSMSGLMPILRASEATGVDLATTSDLVTDSMSALGLQTNELNHYLDVCARAQNKSNTTLTQMQEAYIGVGGTFKTFNTPLQESGALLGILANRGIKGSEAGTKLQSTLVNLTKQSGESAKAMEAIGVSAYDSQGKFKGITNVLKEVQEKTKNLSEEERNNYLTMIAGKTQLTTLNALMAGLSNTLEDGTNEYQALYDTLGNCDGALDSMADTMTNNYAGALARAQSALDDFKITIGAKLEPYVTKFMNWFAAELPGAAEKFSAFMDNKMPKAINFCKTAFEKIKPVVSFAIDNFSELVIVGGTVVVGLKAFSIATKVSGFFNKLSGTMKGYTTAAKLATICQTAFNTSLLACPITRIVAGIAAAAAGMLIWKKHAEKADIAKHFGDITLSAEECTEIVRSVFGEETISKAEEAAGAYDNVKESLERTSDSAKELKKLNFKIQLGDKSISKEDYIATADEYVKNLNDAIKDKQYSLNLDIKLLSGDSNWSIGFLSDTNDYYAALTKQSEDLSEQLHTAIQAAYDADWSPDTTKVVQDLLDSQTEIQEKVQAAMSEAKLETLKYDFSTGDLSVESFENMLNAAEEEMNTLKETYNQSRINMIAQAKLMYGEGSAELAAAIEQANNDYNVKMAEAASKSVQFQVDAIKQAYPEFGETFSTELQKAIDNSANLNLINMKLTNGDNVDYTEIQVAIEEAINAAADAANISEASRANVLQLIDKMMPSIDELKQSSSKLKELPQCVSEALSDVNTLEIAAGKTSAIQDTIASTFENVTDAQKASAKAGGTTFAKSVGDGVSSTESQQYIQKSADILRNALRAALEKPLDVTIPVNTNLSNSNNTDDTDDNATGTNYFGGGFTTINEHGYEIIDLPQGSRIYPHSVSEKMMNGSQNVNVSVNVQGNIFGMENAAEIIGSAVVNRIVDVIRAT